MKRLISATLALSLLGATAAMAAPYSYGDQGTSNGYNNSYGDNGYRDNGYRGRGDDNGGAIVAGVGILALAAILASQNHRRDYDRDRWHDRWGHDRDFGYSSRGFDRR